MYIPKTAHFLVALSTTLRMNSFIKTKVTKYQNTNKQHNCIANILDRIRATCQALLIKAPSERKKEKKTPNTRLGNRNPVCSWRDLLPGWYRVADAHEFKRFLTFPCLYHERLSSPVCRSNSANGVLRPDEMSYTSCN